MRRFTRIFITVFLLFLFLIPGIIKAKETREERFAREAAFLKEYLGDTVYNEFIGHRFILSDFGHDMVSWVAMVEDSVGYRFYRGRSKSYIKTTPDTVHVWERQTLPIEPFDTSSFVSDFRPILEWAFDTLPFIAPVMKPVERTMWSPWSYYTEIVDENGMPRFIRETNDSTFNGPFAHNNFNVKVDKLRQMMMYIAYGQNVKGYP